MNRREFIHRTACAAGAASLHPSVFARHAFALPTLPRKFSAADTVTLGKTGIQTSRLAMGTGTNGSGHHSNQTALGVKGLSGLLLNGYDHGLRFFDSADSYGSHPHVAEALKHVPRDKVTVLTKTWARDPATARADLDRFRRELGIDYIDVCLMHCLTNRKASFAPTAAPATALKRSEPPPSLPGSKSILFASILFGRSWTPIPPPSSA